LLEVQILKQKKESMGFSLGDNNEIQTRVQVGKEAKTWLRGRRRETFVGREK
jgi:hypothetical protein